MLRHAQSILAWRGKRLRKLQVTFAKNASSIQSPFIATLHQGVQEMSAAIEQQKPRLNADAMQGILGLYGLDRVMDVNFDAQLTRLQSASSEIQEACMQAFSRQVESVTAANQEVAQLVVQDSQINQPKEALAQASNIVATVPRERVRAKHNLGKPGTEASADLRPDRAGGNRGSAEVTSGMLPDDGDLQAIFRDDSSLGRGRSFAMPP